jgi:hypothetical protein
VIRTAIAIAAVALIFSAAAAFSFQETPSVKIAVDVNTDGNTGSTVGTIDSCREIAVGDSIDIDVVVMDVPPPATDDSPGGIEGFGMNIHFDPNVLHSTAVISNLMINSPQAFTFVMANYKFNGDANPFPGTTGDSRADYFALGGTPAAGDGVLNRFTFQAVGPGQTDLTVDSELEGVPYPAVFSADSGATIYGVSNLQNARISVGEPCSAPPTPFDPEEPSPTAAASGTAGPTQGPSPTPCPSGQTCGTPVPSNVPADGASVAVDTVPTGNEATSVGEVDECASAAVGETFQVDVIVKDVKDLLAFEMPVSFDPKVLKITDRNVKLFLAGNSGSQVLDASAQTPNNTGIYMASAVDSADPAAPDSGDGILVRLTFNAIAAGTSPIGLDPVSISGTGAADRGILLKNKDNAIIGDTSGDTFFDGPHHRGEIRVGSDCTSGAHVASVDTQPPESNGKDSGTSAWVWVAIAAAVVALVGGAGAGIALMRRRRSLPPQ